ncbi:MAG: threonylcarbamoyl-AMP synthase [Magnetococcales bacterium]|nr:threonylcarbamoyl-AMP synthase [Magnetococcales bacterium]
MRAYPETVAQADVQRAVLALAAGQVIAHPTETVFGLAADPFHPVAVQHLLCLKGRLASKGFIVLIPDRQGLDRLILPPVPLARRLMDHFWPGPLTLVLPARPDLPAEVTGGGGWLAVRQSSSPLVAALLHAWQGPLISTSANPTGQPPARSAVEVHRHWGAAIAVVLAGATPVEAQPSTLLQVEGERVQLLRAGAVAEEAWRAVVGSPPGQS